MTLSPTKSEVLAACRQYPLYGSALAQAYYDLTLAQRWIDVRLVELPKAQRFVLQGRVNAEATLTRTVLPMPLDRKTSMAEILAVIEELDPSPGEVTLGIAAADSSIVYYVAKAGIVAPTETPQ